MVQQLSASGGISFFLFCVRGNRVTTTMQGNYCLFYEVLIEIARTSIAQGQEGSAFLVETY